MKIKCSSCGKYLSKNNKTKEKGVWRHKQCVHKKKSKPAITKETRALLAEKRENPVSKLVRNLKLRYGWI